MAVTRIMAALVVIVVLAFPATARADGQCVVIYDVEKRTTWRSAEGPCASRLSPASTFKIPHALIALETGAIKADAIEKWDGRRFPRQAAWERDHDLRSAISNSVLWFFQRTAVRIGAERMKGWLQQFSYGNTDTSGDPTMFWVNATLQISPNEQVEFLKRFFSDDLPVGREHLAHVQRALLQEPGTVRNATGWHKVAAPWGKSVQLLAKTGATTVKETRVSWLVGALDVDGRRHIFASTVWRTGELDNLDAARQALATFVERGLLEPLP
jgi:beta-lactamase class D